MKIPSLFILFPVREATEASKYYGIRFPMTLVIFA